MKSIIISPGASPDFQHFLIIQERMLKTCFSNSLHVNLMSVRGRSESIVDNESAGRSRYPKVTSHQGIILGAPEM